MNLVALKKFACLLILIVCSFIFTPSYSASDSLVRFSDLKFRSEIEKDVFTRFCSSREKVDLLELFLLEKQDQQEYSSKLAQERIAESVIKLKQAIEGKSEQKKIKIIYETVHKDFLRVYKLQNSFSEIFSKGEYNCVSASALFSVILSELQIPFKIHETPQHVYLVAFPDASAILIETTSPENGYFNFKDEFKIAYINSLLKSKLITKEEFESTSVRDLFTKYYFKAEVINATQLAGLQLYNYGMFNISDSRMEASVEDFKKAYMINPAERISIILKSVLGDLLEKKRYTDPGQVNYLSMLCRYSENDPEVTSVYISNEFNKLINDLLAKNSDFKSAKSSFTLISGSIKDSTLRSDIAFNYHYEVARIGIINGLPVDSAMPHLKKANDINPKNAFLHSLVLLSFNKIVERHSSTSEIYDLLQKYLSDFQFLNENHIVHEIRSNCLLELSYQNFQVGDAKKGESYLRDFETFCNSAQGFIPEERFVERAYTVAAGYYYKKGNSSRSRQVIQTGLKYAPGNFGLKKCLSQL